MLVRPGVLGVSNTFASTLWAIDEVLNMAVRGILRFNFHGEPTGAYTAVVRGRRAA